MRRIISIASFVGAGILAVGFVENNMLSASIPAIGWMFFWLAAQKKKPRAATRSMDSATNLYLYDITSAEAIRAEEQKLAARRRVAENHAERLKNYLMANLNGEKFKSARAAISWRRTTSVQVNDIYKLPDDLLRYKEPEPDKKLIKLAIEEGRPIEGAELVESQSMIIK